MHTHTPDDTEPRARSHIRPGRVLVGTITGFVAGLVVGVAVLRLVASLDAADTGWEDLTSIAASLVSFGPVGALTGALVAGRRVLLPWFRGRHPAARVGTWIGLGLPVAGALAAAMSASDASSPIALGVLLSPVGAVAGHLLGALGAATTGRRLTGGSL